MGDSDAIKCVVCADDATPRIVKDNSYLAMMGLFWEAMKVDVKFIENTKFNLCEQCFLQIHQFYDLNDSCVIMEKRLQALTRRLMNRGIESANKIRKEGKDLPEVLTKITSRHGTRQLDENEDENGISFKYDITTEQVDTAADRASRRIKPAADSGKVVFSFNTPPAKGGQKDKAAAVSEPKKNPAAQTKPPRGKARGIRRGPPPARKPKKRVRKKSAWSSTDEDDDEDDDDEDEDFEAEGGVQDDEKEEENVYANNTDEETEHIQSIQDLSTLKQSERPTSEIIPDEQVLSEEEKQQSDDKTEKSDSSGKSRLQCEICFIAFPSAKAYDQHIHRHTIKPGTGFQCHACRKAFELKGDFLAHKRLHDAGRYICPVCSIEVNIETKMSSHVQIVHKDFWNRQPQVLCPPGST